MTSSQDPDRSLSHPSPTGAALELANAHSSPDPALKLYGGWFCPFVQRAWIVLVEKGIPHQYVEINPYHKSPEFVALNPRGLIPTLVVSEHPKKRVLYESTVVCEYLDEQYGDDDDSTGGDGAATAAAAAAAGGGGEKKLMPQDVYERARCRLWINHVSTKIIPAWYGVMQAQDLEGQEEQRAKLRDGIKAFVREMLDGAQGEGPWFLGEMFSLVDVSLAPWAKRLWLIDHYKTPGGTGIPKKSDVSGMEDDEKKVWDRWYKWFEAVVSRESVVRTWSEDEKYIGVYKRYADNTTQSEVAKATREGKSLP